VDEKGRNHEEFTSETHVSHEAAPSRFSSDEVKFEQQIPTVSLVWIQLRSRDHDSLVQVLVLLKQSQQKEKKIQLYELVCSQNKRS
jgi:hypothetical protein